MVTIVKEGAETAPPATAENADLAGLVAEAEALESGPQPGQWAKEPEPSTSAADLEAALKMLQVMAAPAFTDWPAYGQVWGPDTIKAIAENGGAIMDRHGLSMGEVMSTWGPYIGLVLAVAPPSFATLAHLKQRKARQEWLARARANVTGPVPADGSKPDGVAGDS